MADAGGWDPAFKQAIDAMIAASGGKLYIVSGYRSVAEQQALWDEAVAKYGSEEAARTWVAPPGSSNHNRGMAVDLGGDIALAHELAPRFGLVFPMSWEPWHIEPVYARGDSPPEAYTTPPPGEKNPVYDEALNGQPEFMAASLANAMRGLSDPTMSGAISDPTAPGALAAGSAEEPATTAAKPGASGAVAGGAGPFGGVEEQRWATDFLERLGVPITSENMRAVTAWMQAESGGGGGAFNPLNTTQGGFAGESDYNSVGVKNYTSYEQGLDANVKVINNGMYQPILDALARGSSAIDVARAIGQTPWGTGQLVEKILGGS